MTEGAVYLSSDTLTQSQRTTMWVSRVSVPLFCLFVSYCAMVPFGNWVQPTHDIWQVLLYGWMERIFVFDIIQNLLLYLPLGFFAVFSFKSKHWGWGLTYAFMISLLMCGLLEYLQSYNPARVPSALDIILNTLSGFIGGVVAAVFYEWWVKQFALFGQSLHPSSKNNPIPIIALLSIVLWGAYHWYPYLPTLHPEYIRQGYAPFMSVLNDINTLNGLKLFIYSAQGLLLYAFALLAFKTRPIAFILSFIAMILPFKVLLIGRVLSFEAIAGCLLGLTLGYLLHVCFKLSWQAKH